ncbi:hypothetical protein APSETT444_010336 [Aspergillus pseudonomiae]
MPRSKAVTSKLIVQERLPDLNVSKHRTKNSALHNIHFVGPLTPWPNFLGDVEWEFLTHKWASNQYPLDLRPIGETNSHSLQRAHCLVGNEPGVQGRWQEHLGNVMTAVLQEQQFQLSFGDFVCSGVQYDKVPDLVLLNTTPDILIISELKGPWVKQHKLDKAVKRNTKFRHVPVTGQMDTDYWETIGCPDDIYFGPTEGAHIIPFSYASWDKSSVEPPNDNSSAWEVLWRCFPRVRREGLRVETINNLSNGITLRYSVHTEFGKFSIALKPADRDDTYEVKVFRRYPKLDRQLLPQSGYIELKKAHDAQDLDLPNRALLDCHYRLAEILNASGMAEVIERNFREWEDLKRQFLPLTQRMGVQMSGSFYALACENA